MTTLHVTSTARASFSVCLLAQLLTRARAVRRRWESTGAAAYEPRAQSSCLLQRGALVKIQPNGTLQEPSELAATTTGAMSEALGWLGDIFAEEVEPLFNTTTVRRVHLQSRWSSTDKLIFLALTVALVSEAQMDI